jgi:MFS transporter, SHS family, lactate transporter
MFPTYLQEEVGLSPAFVALPVMLQSLMFFLFSFFWG